MLADWPMASKDSSRKPDQHRFFDVPRLWGRLALREELLLILILTRKHGSVHLVGEYPNSLETRKNDHETARIRLNSIWAPSLPRHGSRTELT